MSSKDKQSTTFRSSQDPYDLWATELGVKIRCQYYAGRLSGKAGAVGLGLLDWLFPGCARGSTGAVALHYPIVVAHEVLSLYVSFYLDQVSAKNALKLLGSIASQKGDSGWSWGLGFPWMSKNGLYGPDVSFVTHTPYVMEALLFLAEIPSLHDEAMKMFHGTWYFLESLKVMYQDEDTVALSYAPVNEPRIVVNANAYAAFAYALHAVHGRPEIQGRAREKARQLILWVVRQQRGDGAWWYYADNESGNFIDCFHSCFVVKNLLKVQMLLPDLGALIFTGVVKGWNYIRNHLYDTRHGICRRFTVRPQRDPFCWDLYDQAEYLGLMVDFSELEQAREFVLRVEKRFRKGDDWYCRIDLFGRRWGRNFLRWGIVPFLYHRARLEKALAELG